MGEVVSKVSDRWINEIDKKEPELDQEFLRNMRDAVYDIHKTEGYPNVKIAKARNSEDDWLTKLVAKNTAMKEQVAA